MMYEVDRRGKRKLRKMVEALYSRWDEATRIKSAGTCVMDGADDHI